MLYLSNTASPKPGVVQVRRYEWRALYFSLFHVHFHDSFGSLTRRQLEGKTTLNLLVIDVETDL